MLLPYPEPPTETALNNARRELDLQRGSLVSFSKKIEEAEVTLAQIIAESKCAINEMQRERSILEDKMSYTMAYLAPIRRLPDELVRHIFMFNFEDYPCCAWVLAAVSSLWRRLALSMPRLWSKVRSLSAMIYWLNLTYLACVDPSSHDTKLFSGYYPLVAGKIRKHSTIRHRNISSCQWRII